MSIGVRRMQPGAGVVLLLSFLGGCAGTDADKRQAKERWDAARGVVKASLAAQQLSDGDVRAAEASIGDAQRLSPDLGAVDLIAARIEIAKGNFVRARERLLAAEVADSNAEASYLVGVTYMAQADWAAALNRFQRAVALAPEDEEYVRALVQACLGMGYAAGAREIIEERAARTGWTASLHAALAECAERQGRFAEAADDWLRAAEEDAARDAVRGRTAYALLRVGRLAEAAPLLSEELASANEAVGLAQRLALVDARIAQGDLARAEEALGPLRGSLTGNPGVQRRVALLLARRGRCAQALDVLAPLTDDTSTDVAALELAVAIAHLGSNGAAQVRLARRLAAVDPDSPVLRQLEGAASGPNR